MRKELLREWVVNEARRFVGVRFRHQGRALEPGNSGVDCLGLLMAVAHNLRLQGRRGELLTAFDTADYSKSPDGDFLLGQLTENLFPATAPSPGDIALFRFDHNPQHLAILTPYIYGGLGMVHAYAPARKVVEHRLDPVWQGRIVKVFAVA